MELTLLVVLVNGGSFCLASLLAHRFEHPLARLPLQEVPSASVKTD